VTLFNNFNLEGERLRIEDDTPNLGGTPWNDRAVSMIVRGSRWQLCVDANYRGGCQVFEPGRYDNLGGLSRKLSSLRRVR
jgi:hypothetical protein